METTIVYDVFLSARDKWYIVVGRFGFVAQELITKSPVSLEAFTKGNRLRRRLLFQTFPLCLIKRAQKSFFSFLQAMGSLDELPRYPAQIKLIL